MNTGVGCHFLLQCVKVKSESESTQSCPTLSDPRDCSLPGSSIHGIFQARVLEQRLTPSVCQTCFEIGMEKIDFKNMDTDDFNAKKKKRMNQMIYN